MMQLMQNMPAYEAAYRPEQPRDVYSWYDWFKNRAKVISIVILLILLLCGAIALFVAYSENRVVIPVIESSPPSTNTPDIPKPSEAVKKTADLVGALSTDSTIVKMIADNVAGLNNLGNTYDIF
jgi:hypothetical protein